MCCLSRRSGQITFRSGESYGFIYIQHGRVLHALCGTTEGEEAIYAMLLWPGGGFSLDEDILPHKKTVTLTWEQLLFEGARRADRGATAPKSAAPTITAAESQPKLTINRPDLPPVVFKLEQEYTHVGRASNNEISLPYPSISNRHCIFVQSGPDVVLRDLNSSNGTYVNNELINEAILRPNDLIQVGTVTIKFEPGVKRPKLNAPPTPAPDKEMGTLKTMKTQGTGGALYYQTAKLPAAPARPAKPTVVKDDSSYVKGEAPISYDTIAKPEVEESNHLMLYVIIAVVLVVLGGACYYFFVLPHGAH
jgi:pSer/pThr/pTyr-binding forkhead associated (FHA) protein